MEFEKEKKSLIKKLKMRMVLEIEMPKKSRTEIAISGYSLVMELDLTLKCKSIKNL